MDIVKETAKKLRERVSSSQQLRETLDAGDAALAELERREAEQAAEIAETKRANEVERLRPLERKAAQQVVDAVLALDGALADWLTVCNELTANGASSRRTPLDTYGLAEKLHEVQQRWRLRSPELLGLPPLPSPEDVRRDEAERNLERAQARLRALEALPHSLEKQRLIEQQRWYIDNVAKRCV